VLRRGFDLPDAVVIPQSNLCLGDPEVEVVVTHPPVLKGADCLLDDGLANVRAGDGATRSWSPLNRKAKKNHQLWCMSKLLGGLPFRGFVLDSEKSGPWLP
jgi:hypothetical protein